MSTRECMEVRGNMNSSKKKGENSFMQGVMTFYCELTSIIMGKEKDDRLLNPHDNSSPLRILTKKGRKQRNVFCTYL